MKLILFKKKKSEAASIKSRGKLARASKCKQARHARFILITVTDSVSERCALLFDVGLVF